MGGQRKRSRAECRELVAGWRASALTQGVFAKRKGIAPASPSWWACRLRREVPIDPSERQALRGTRARAIAEDVHRKTR